MQLACRKAGDVVPEVLAARAIPMQWACRTIAADLPPLPFGADGACILDTFVGSSAHGVRLRCREANRGALRLLTGLRISC